MEEKQEQSLWERLQHNYRLVIMNHETFEEVGSYRLSLMNVYIFISVIVVVVAILMFLLFAYTPAKNFLPGVGNVSDNSELMAITKAVDSLEEIERANAATINAVQNILESKVQTEDDIEDNIPVAEDADLEVEKIDIDQEFREEIELEDIGEKAREGRPTTGFSPQDIPLEQMYFTTPVKGQVSAGFMPDKNHVGVDVVAAKNTAIKVVLDGTVISSDWTVETGNTIGVQHANNVITWYKHNSSLLKKTGEFVRAGEAIAIIGNTGDLTDGPHLHFELWHKGKPVDPEDYINFN